VKLPFLLFSERILVYSQELLTEVIEELHVIHEVALEEALWFLHATIQPFHANLLPDLRRTHPNELMFRISIFKTLTVFIKNPPY